MAIENVDFVEAVEIAATIAATVADELPGRARAYPPS